MFEYILIGPGTNLFPIVNSSLKATNLPILNIELLLINIQFLEPVSSKIYIVILKEDVDNIRHVVKNITTPLEIIGIDFYDGTVTQLHKLQQKINSENIIVTKGNLVTNIDIKTIANEYLDNNDLFMTILTNNQENTVCGIKGNELIHYSDFDDLNISKDILIKNRFVMTLEKHPLQFYMFKKDILKYITSDMFSFRSNFLPAIVKTLCNINPVKIFDPMNTYIYQIRDVESYIFTIKKLKSIKHNENGDAICSYDKINLCKQYIKKKNIKDTKNILGTSLFIDSGFIIDSVIGNNVTINEGSYVVSSILMNNIIIGKNCHIEECLIGNNVTIPDNTTLIKCNVSPAYIFSTNVNAKNNIFTCS